MISHLRIVNVVNLVKDHPLQVPDDLRAVVKHGPEKERENGGRSFEALSINDEREQPATVYLRISVVMMRHEDSGLI